MENVKVIIWGLGAMGGGIADMLLKKKGVDIVGVAGRGAFGYVLLARACGLYHLVDGAVALLKEVVGEVECHIIDTLGFLVCDEVLVGTSVGKKWCRRGHNRIG